MSLEAALKSNSYLKFLLPYKYKLMGSSHSKAIDIKKDLLVQSIKLDSDRLVNFLLSELSPSTNKSILYDVLEQAVKLDSVKIFGNKKFEPLFQQARYTFTYQAVEHNSAKILQNITTNHPGILQLPVDEEGGLTIDTLVTLAVDSNAPDALRELLLTSKYDASKLDSHGQPQVMELIFDAIKAGHPQTLLTLLEYAEIEINALNEESIPYIQEFLNYAVEIDEDEIVLALMKSDALFNAINHFADELGIKKDQILQYVVNMVIENAVDEDAVKTFSLVIKFAQEHTHFFANPSDLSILLQSIAQKDAGKISALILEDDSLLLKPQSSDIEFNLYVAIKEDNLNSAKKLLEDLEFSDIKDIVDIIIVHDAEEIMHYIIDEIEFNRESRKFLAECINTAIINNSNSVLQVLLNSTLMTEIFSNEAQKNWMVNYLLNVINKNSSEAGLASLILIVGDVEESDIDILMGLAIKNNLTWVMDWMFKNDYEIDRAKDPRFIFEILDDAINEDNGAMIAYLVSKIKIDPLDSDEVARYEEILNSLMEQSIRYESIDTLHKLISLRGNFDINSPLNKMKQSALQIALTDFEPTMFWFLVEEYLKTEKSVAEAMSHLDDMKMNLWHYAADYHDKSKIQALLNSMFEFFGEDGINQQNSGGNTPIMISAANRHLEGFEFFAEHNADATITNDDAKTAVFYALSPKDANQSNIPATNKELVLGFMSIIEEHNIPIDSESEELIDTHYQSFLSKIEDDSQQSGYDADSENELFDPEYHEDELHYINLVHPGLRHKTQEDLSLKSIESDGTDSGIEDRPEYEADSENEEFDPEENEFSYISFVPTSDKIRDDQYSKRRESDGADSGIEDISYLSEGTASPARDAGFTSQISTSPQVEATGMNGLFDGLYDGLLVTAC